MTFESPLVAGVVLAAAVLIGWTLLLVGRRVLGARIAEAAKKTRTTVDDLAVHLVDRTGLAETRAAELEAATAIMRDVVSAAPRVRFNRAQLKRAVPAGFEFEIVYFFESPDYDLYAATHHDVLITILKGFDERGIALAAPLLPSEQLTGA
jgi:hypothetical protein